MSNQLFTLKDVSTNPFDARLVYISSSKYEGDWNSIPHTHNFVEVFYVLGGRGRFLVGDEAFEVNENDYVIVNPHVRHTETSWLSSPLHYIVFGIDGINFDFTNGGSENNSDYRLFSYQDQRSKMQVYLKTILSEMQAQQPYYDTVCHSVLQVLLIDIMRQSNFTFSVISKKVNAASKAVKSYIDAHFKENISLDDLAGYAHINKYYLTHTFTKDYGISPMSYISYKRIEECKNLLETTDLSISQVSSITGFSSHSYFSQIFKKITGVSPAKYREQIDEMKKTK